MSTAKQVSQIQRFYPQIWFACHLEHRTRSSSADGLTDREAGILAHIDAAEGARASDIARHLGISKSTLSAQLKRLAGLSLVGLERGAVDQRERSVRLTAQGRKAVVSRSPLDASRVGALLRELSPPERDRAVAGLELLAAGARRLRTNKHEESGT